MAKIISYDNKVNKTYITSEENLEKIKDKIKDSYDYFEENYKSYVENRRFIYDTSLSDDQVKMLETLDKPVIEINIGEAYVSRLVGEFYKQEPSLKIAPENENVSLFISQTVEDYIRGMFFEANQNGMQIEVYKEALSGGFSAVKVYTDYLGTFDMKQGIFLKKCYDPTLVGFDKMAMMAHKGDGEYCFECYPMSKKRFEEEFDSLGAKELTEKIKFSKSSSTQISGFKWSFQNQGGNSKCTDTILICDFYEKKRKKIKIVLLSNGATMTEKRYKEIIKNWNSVIQPPIALKSRITTDTIICRTRLVESGILEYEETDFRHLPLVFFDGNSALLKSNTMSAARQKTRSILYHERDVQKLKNLAAITLANELENLIQSKIMVPIEGLPEQYRDAYKDIQKASVLLFHAFKRDNPAVAVPSPMPVQRQPIPPEIAQTFQMCDQASQMVLGTFDASLGINNNQLSGVAIVEGATQSNAAAMPHVINNMISNNQIAEIIVDLIPKYIVTPQSIPIKNFEGKMGRRRVNDSQENSLDYQPGDLRVKVTAGVNFEIQKARAYNMFVELMKTFPMFQEFLSQPEVLETVLDNIDIRGIDVLKQAIPKFLQQQQMSKQQAAQMNPIAIQQQQLQLKQNELMQKSQNDQVSNQLESKKIGVSQEEADTKRMGMLLKMGHDTDKLTLESEKVQAEKSRTAVEAASQLKDMKHRHAVDILKIHHSNEHKNKDRLRQMIDNQINKSSNNFNDTSSDEEYEEPADLNENEYI